jgi:hypothetical protein
MQLTVCLVTRGREEYLDKLLSSFDELLLEKDVQFLIIDNGSPTKVAERLATWNSHNKGISKLVRLEKNDSRPSTFWKLIQDSGADWIIMPGDDDVLMPEGLREWRRALDQNPLLVAFGASADVINEDGALTGDSIFPSIHNLNSIFDRLSTALHGPVFIWPSLFFRVSKVPAQVPSSRYAFDWWAGINLLLSGQIQTTKSSILQYRIHSNQESSLAPLQRKFFEGTIWLNEFLHSSQYRAWVLSLNDNERITFWRSVSKLQPIYGDVNFGLPITFEVARQLVQTAKYPKTASTIINDLALKLGVVLKKGEANNLFLNMTEDIELGSSNIAVSIEIGACKALESAAEHFERDSTAKFTSIRLSCTHSTKSGDSIFINCSNLSGNFSQDNADILVNEITKHSENIGGIPRAISSGEMRMVIGLNALWSRIPRKLRNVIRSVFH